MLLRESQSAYGNIPTRHFAIRQTRGARYSTLEDGIRQFAPEFSKMWTNVTKRWRNRTRTTRSFCLSLQCWGWCREGESNPQGTKYRRILSPLRLPVPPSRLITGESTRLME